MKKKMIKTFHKWLFHDLGIHIKYLHNWAASSENIPYVHNVPAETQVINRIRAVRLIISPWAHDV